jgi:hypothetical protein
VGSLRQVLRRQGKFTWTPEITSEVPNHWGPGYGGFTEASRTFHFPSSQAQALGINMNRIEFTPEEEPTIQVFAAAPSGTWRRVHSWTAEVVPGVALLVFGLWSGRHTFIIAGFLPLVLFSTLRAFRQFKYSTAIQSICLKIQRYQSDANSAQPLRRANRRQPPRSL